MSDADLILKRLHRERMVTYTILEQMDQNYNRIMREHYDRHPIGEERSAETLYRLYKYQQHLNDQLEDALHTFERRLKGLTVNESARV
jgi:hypothetical protein